MAVGLIAAARRRTSPAGSVGDYTVLSKSADQAFTANGVVTFDGVAFGNATLFSDAADQLIVPPSISLIRMAGAFFETNGRHSFRKNASLALDGVQFAVNKNQGRISFGSPPMAVSAGDVFDFYRTQITNGTDAGATWTWLAIELMDPTTKYCIAQRNADALIAANTTTNPLAFDGADIIDASAMHDPTTNNSRIFIPSGVALARPFLLLSHSGTSGEVNVWTDKTGASPPGRANFNLLNNNPGEVAAYGAIVPVVGGTDYFTMGVFNGTTSFTIKGGTQQTFFGVECLPSGTSYCTAYKGATQALTANVATTLLLESEVADTDNCHDTTANKGNFVCPSGKTRGRLSFNVKTVTGVTEVVGLKNGSQVQGMPQCKNDSSRLLNAFGSWVPVTSGDILSAQITSTSNQTLPIANETWVCVEWA